MPQGHFIYKVSIFLKKTFCFIWLQLVFVYLTNFLFLIDLYKCKKYTKEDNRVVLLKNKKTIGDGNLMRMDGEEFPNAIRVDDGEINRAVRMMRPSVNISTAEFRRKWEIIYQKLLPVYFNNFKGDKKNIGLVVILRAGSAGFLAMKDTLLEYDMSVFLVWTFRNEISIEAEMLRCNLPERAHPGMVALVLDPMLATGTSSILTIDELRRRGFWDITCIFGVASIDGLRKLRDNCPSVKSIVGFTGPNIRLNEKGYVVYESGEPVVDDAGDRWMGLTGKGNLLRKQ